ncbi:predicted protein [Naegleria gruberi]|uniref:Predicted protein n=1 Tax=Naegleria gruberi TaxID=5762 RepID=D2W6C6_NAEGR|nr:uncharacterized protein NAEGRDRAFT_76969 [Naegleria gruberi]EFC35376.1 predicted protein [Naegleria gruberi]|eukprot:XP_002668120.1 predicted protein [Naegleria gruberi strain NEG-M]
MHKLHDKEYSIKCSIMGGVGKTSIVFQFFRNMLCYDLSCVDDYAKYILVDENTFRIEIFDTDAAEEYSTLRDQCIRSSKCFILVCDVFDFKSINSLKFMIEQILNIKESNDIPIVFTLNKIDLINNNNLEEMVEKLKMKLILI